MKLEKGLFDGCVLQRNARGVCDVTFSGRCEGTGLLRVTAFVGKRKLPSCDDVKAGTAEAGTFTGRLRGLPVGGPYRIELRIVAKGADIGTLSLKTVYVGDVWVAGGQSNMQGSGLKKFAPPQVPQVRAFRMDDQWCVAHEPLHNMWACVDEAHLRINGGVRQGAPTNEADVDWTMGPAIPFAYAMWKATGVPQAVIACAHGGTSMAQWNPDTPDDGGLTLYGATVRRVKKNGGRVAGLIWYQGESDSGPEAAPLYTERMKTLIASFRRDCGGQKLPVAIVQLCRHTAQDDTQWWNSIQEQQRRLPEFIENLMTVPAIDSGLRDGIHLDGPGAVEVGNRLALAMLHLQGHKKGIAPVELKGWRIDGDSNETRIYVQFANVVGSLKSGSRPSGFYVVDSRGLNHTFRIDLEGSQVCVRADVGIGTVVGMSLHYGYMRDPYCNIVDEAGRSLPVFGPLLLGPSHSIMPFVRRLKVSEPMPWTKGIHAVTLASRQSELTEREFRSDFCTIMCELSTRAAANRLVFASFTVEWDEPMKLSLQLGYDGPVKVWLDNKQIYCDPKGHSPSEPDDAQIPLPTKPGRYQVAIALLSNEAATWGIFVRLELRDAPLQGLPDVLPPRLPRIGC